ncbi:unnamed protein product [Notodromas monacha]|uniref:Uncharacterized protein n=1 Tax=Notodromas monacha TaxID=399045 RepID=A0A7R9BRN6_9CRUS|nr:unnamed protein product [Notodromas monacha]CAG0920431.1 unnamed protein product [Notodromas monacha]
MKEAVPKRPSKTRLTLSTSSGNLTEGIVQANFEEFHLDFPPAASPSSTSSSGSDYHSTTSGGSSSRRPGTPHQVRDGAETSGCETDDDASTKSAPASGSAAGAGGSSDTTANKLVHFSGSYEKFLEATGLSQKSIIVHRPTPNNNHRSVVKPKDVKNRSKLNKLSVFHDNHNQGLLDQQPVTGLVKYWTEPYL